MIHILTPLCRQNTDACVRVSYSGGLGASPVHVIDLGDTDLEGVNCGHTDTEYVVDRSKDEDEDDVPDDESQSTFLCKEGKHKNKNT